MSNESMSIGISQSARVDAAIAAALQASRDLTAAIQRGAPIETIEHLADVSYVSVNNLKRLFYGSLDKCKSAECGACADYGDCPVVPGSLVRQAS